jgi:crotonobetainyl-CoA:carnitine CoA-transferase CaiB-like acyl-CoA transferase
MTRDLPPYFVNGTSAYFLGVNRNKESIVIDLKHPEGKELFLDLVRAADIVLENFRPGVLARLGIDYHELQKNNPAIVLCSITGFGLDTPDPDRPAYDMIVQALSGVMSLTGESQGIPLRTGVPIGDLAAGMFGAMGALAALTSARNTGEGSHVDISMLDGQISLLSYLAEYYLISGEVPGPQGRGHLSIPTYRSFGGSDERDFVVCANTQAMWIGMCEAIGLDQLPVDGRFASNVDRYENRHELWQILEERFHERPAHDWVEELQRRHVPVALIHTVEESLTSPDVRRRNMVVRVDKYGQTLDLVGSPIKYTDRKDVPPCWPPDFGEHTGTVLRDLLGLTDAEIRHLVSVGAVLEERESTNGQ